MTAGGKTVREGEWITLDGGEGVVYEGDMPPGRTLAAVKSYEILMKWADGGAPLGVRTNADTFRRTRASAREFGAEGIGLVPHRSTCSSPDFEHSREKPVNAVRAVQENDPCRYQRSARVKAWIKLLPFQRP